MGITNEICVVDENGIIYFTNMLNINYRDKPYSLKKWPLEEICVEI